MADGDESCAACGATTLVPHLRVSGAVIGEGLVPTTDRFGTALGDIVRCTSCGHMQLDRLPQASELADAYGEAESSDYVDEEAGQRATAGALLDEIERHVAPGALLDLGCWVGFVLAEARDRGWETRGVEPSAFASAYARERLGLEVETAGLFEAELPERHFQAVFLGDVIEHLPDPGGALDRIAALLAPGGVVAIALPDAGSRVARLMGSRWWSIIPTHVQYFTRGSIRTLLEARGYELRAIGTQPKTFSVGYYLGRLGGYRPGVGAALVRGSAAVGLRDRPWTPDFRDRMLVIARPRPTPTPTRSSPAASS
jgi:SAM-dependent methyltransferase